MGQYANATVEQARTLIERVMETNSFRERAAFFCETCKRLEKEDLDVKVVEALLASVEKKARVIAV